MSEDTNDDVVLRFLATDCGYERARMLSEMGRLEGAFESLLEWWGEHLEGDAT